MNSKIFKLLIFVFGIYSHSTINAQKVSFSFSTGIGDYQMSQLSTFTNVIKEGLPFPVESVSDFPIYWNYDADIGLRIDKLKLGLAYGFQTTGNHLSQSDYSGSYNLKMKVKSHSPGIRCEYLINENKVQLYISGTIGVHISTMNLHEEIAVYTQSETESFEFKSSDVFFEPGFKALYPVNFINLFLSAGYHLQPDQNPLKLDGKDDMELTIPDKNKRVALDWTGFRLRAGLGISF